MVGAYRLAQSYSKQAIGKFRVAYINTKFGCRQSMHPNGTQVLIKMEKKRREKKHARRPEEVNEIQAT